jgi:hypothetical protein
MMTRESLLQAANNSNLLTHLSKLASACMHAATVAIAPATEDGLTQEQRTREADKVLLNNVGPAAAASAVEFAILHCQRQGKFGHLQFTNNFINNVRMIQNDTNSTMPGYDVFSGTLRQFLAPRSGYLDFDAMVDPRHPIDLECGYPKQITPAMYRYMYDRDETATRVNDIYADESWAVDPQVYEDEDEDTLTPFEAKLKYLYQRNNLLNFWYRMDKLAGVGHYGVLLLGISGDDNNNLDQPINEPALLRGEKNTVSVKERELLYLRPFDEYLAYIQEYETDESHPRFGLPKFYNLVFVDMTIDAAGASVGTRVNKRVHWTRIIHVADNLLSSLVLGTPRMQRPFNRLLDLRKIKGGSAEMFWKGAFPGISFEIDPKFVADSPDYDDESLKLEIDRYASGLQRYLRLIGIKANTLDSNISEHPDKHINIHLALIASHAGIPLRIFMGSEEARLASSQDQLTWNRRLFRRLRTFVEPELIRNTIDRFIAIGILPEPAKKEYFVAWGDLNTTTDEDKANLALKWTQALSQYVATGIIHLFPPMEFLTLIMGLRPRDAKLVLRTVDLAKLLKVDPSQGAGVNGKRQNIADTSKKAEGNKPDKAVDGMKG